jgi:L-alanine-DL-glutamate epimerase-like enolase superfamily enzyme
VAERLGTPLLALVTSDEPSSWGEATTLRRATRVAVTNAGLRNRVAAAGVAEDRVELWRALLPSALGCFDQIAGRTLRTAAKSATGR